MTETKDPEIKAQNFLYGMKVVDIGDIRVARGLSRRAHSSCRHANMIFDNSERRIWCKDCEKDVEGFDAFQIIVQQWASAYKDLSHRQDRLDEAESHSLFSLAAKHIDKVWRSRKQVPACVCCGNGILPEDFKDGCKTIIGKDYALQKRKKRP